VDDVALMPVVDAAPNVETMGMSMAGKPTGDKENPMIVMGKSMVSCRCSLKFPSYLPYLNLSWLNPQFSEQQKYFI